MSSKILTFTLFLFLTTSVSAHSWYPWSCCHDLDCHPVPCDQITESKDGLKWGKYTFKREDEKPSQDQYCHVCIVNGSPKCIFTQQNF